MNHFEIHYNGPKKRGTVDSDTLENAMDELFKEFQRWDIYDWQKSEIKGYFWNGEYLDGRSLESYWELYEKAAREITARPTEDREALRRWGTVDPAGDFYEREED